MARNFGSGGEYIEIAANAIFDSTFGSVAFRWRAAVTGGWEVAGRHQAATSYNGWGFSITGSPNRMQFYGKTSSGSSSAFGVVDASVNATDGNWHSAVGRYNRGSGGTGDLMVDGTSTAQATGVTAWNPTGQVIRIGRSLDTYWTEFLGDVEDFAFWDVRLTADEARAYCNGVAPGAIRPQSLKLWLPLGN